MIITLKEGEGRHNDTIVVDQNDRRIEGPATCYNCVEKTQYRINNRSIWVENDARNNSEITSQKWTTIEIRTVYKCQL